MVIPSSVTSVGESAFENCAALTSVTLGSSIESIGIKAFALCQALTEVVSNIKNPFVLDNSVFPTIVKMIATLYVPEGTMQSYQSTKGWLDFLNIKEGENVGIDLVEVEGTGGDSHWYTLQGMRLNDAPTTRGIFIRNGRKVMVK